MNDNPVPIHAIGQGTLGTVHLSRAASGALSAWSGEHVPRISIPKNICGTSSSVVFEMERTSLKSLQQLGDALQGASVDITHKSHYECASSEA